MDAVPRLPSCWPLGGVPSITPALIDHVLGDGVTVWRLRDPASRVELACRLAQPRPGVCQLRFEANGRPLRAPGERRARRFRNALTAAVQTAEQWRLALLQHGWRDIEEEH